MLAPSDRWNVRQYVGDRPKPPPAFSPRHLSDEELTPDDRRTLAKGRRHLGSPREAIFEAAQLRLRPILMTNLAALLGAMPLVLATGEGVEMRRPLGLAIAGGLIVSQLLTLYTVPVIYLALDRLRARVIAWSRRLRRQPVPATGPRALPDSL